MKSTINVFQGGITTDLHPLATPKDVLTDAHNATMLTFNGNENILQNDMGNAQVIDAKTGNMIGLSDGFVPVGIKEHGGVLYIASYNPKTKQGELGTIPSPRIEYTLQNRATEVTASKLITGINEEDILIDNKVSSEYIPIDTETIFRIGDQFLVMLDLKHILTLHGQKLLTHYENTSLVPQLYRIDLYSKTIQGTYEKINTPEVQYYYDSKGNITSSDNWFLPIDADVNIDRTYKDPNLLITYPNIPSGYLCIKIEVEKPKNLSIIKNSTVNINCPIYYIL